MSMYDLQGYRPAGGLDQTYAMDVIYNIIMMCAMYDVIYDIIMTYAMYIYRD